MAIVSFWSPGNVEAGKTVNMAAISTFLTIENNYKILIINTEPGDTSLEDCFWDFSKDNNSWFKNKNKTDLGTGIEGLMQSILSNKTNPNIITNYTRTIFKDSLEVLTYKNYSEVKEETIEKQAILLKEIIKMASSYYDFVFFNLEGELNNNLVNVLLEVSNLRIINLNQNLRQIDNYIQIKQNNLLLNRENTITIIGKCDVNSKYNAKNISRYVGEKEIFAVPYNTLFLEACNEGKVAELFIKFRKINPTDPNAEFFDSIKTISKKIKDKLQEIQMRI